MAKRKAKIKRRKGKSKKNYDGLFEVPAPYRGGKCVICRKGRRKRGISLCAKCDSFLDSL